MSTQKSVNGHKRKSVSFGVSVECECGWRSSTWYGKGASSNAHGEWRGHTDHFARIAAIEAGEPSRTLSEVAADKSWKF